MGNLLLTFSPVDYELADMSEAGGIFTGALFGVLMAIFAVVGALSVGYAIFLGYQLAKSEDESKRKQAKSRILKTVAGLFLITVLVSVVIGEFTAGLFTGTRDRSLIGAFSVTIGGDNTRHSIFVGEELQLGWEATRSGVRQPANVLFYRDLDNFDNDFAPGDNDISSQNVSNSSVDASVPGYSNVDASAPEDDLVESIISITGEVDGEIIIITTFFLNKDDQVLFIAERIIHVTEKPPEGGGCGGAVTLPGLGICGNACGGVCGGIAPPVGGGGPTFPPPGGFRPPDGGGGGGGAPPPSLNLVPGTGGTLIGNLMWPFSPPRDGGRTSSFNDHLGATRGGGTDRHGRPIPRTYHGGIDISNPAGTGVYAVADGKITGARPAGTSQRGVSVNHGRINIPSLGGSFNVWVYYHHIIPEVFTAGQEIKRGQLIGRLATAAQDDTLNGTSPHLHMEVAIHTVATGWTAASNPMRYQHSWSGTPTLRQWENGTGLIHPLRLFRNDPAFWAARDNARLPV
jgi:murein DD-endopeptidase MepM/ murein hydrolase activator NlpD